jgi:hypothetical protein
MPLRDHFRPPVENEHSWDELHGMWPAVIVQQLFPMLPAGYIAAPRVHLGTAFEIDVSTFERNEPAHHDRPSDGSSGVAVAPWSPPIPTLTLETELPDQDALVLEQSLPTLPIWLDDDLGVLLDLGTSYEETCRFLRIV